MYPEEVIQEKFDKLNEQMSVICQKILKINACMDRYGIDIMRIKNEIEHLIEEEDEAGGSCESDLY